jgi:hypothetical protein
LIWFSVFNATFSNISAISWWPVLVVEVQESWGTYKQGYLQFVNIWHIVHIIINDLFIFPFDLHTWKYLLSSDKCDTNILSSLFDFLRDVNMHVWFPVKKSLFRIAGISYFNTTVMSLILVFLVVEEAGVPRENHRP